MQDENEFGEDGVGGKVRSEMLALFLFIVALRSLNEALTNMTWWCGEKKSEDANVGRIALRVRWSGRRKNMSKMSPFFFSFFSCNVGSDGLNETLTEMT